MVWYTERLYYDNEWYTPRPDLVLLPPNPLWGVDICIWHPDAIGDSFRSNYGLPNCGILRVSGRCGGSPPMSLSRRGGWLGQMPWKFWRASACPHPSVPGSATSGWPPLPASCCPCPRYLHKLMLVRGWPWAQNLVSAPDLVNCAVSWSFSHSAFLANKTVPVWILLKADHGTTMLY